jgi:hypothetical protein
LRKLKVGESTATAGKGHFDLKADTYQKRGLICHATVHFSATYPHSTFPARMNPPTQRPTTRAKNADQHPGRVDKKYRRTKAEIEHDRAMLQEKKEAKEQAKKAVIARVAQLEDQMAIEEANIGSAHPRNRSGYLIVLCFRYKLTAWK